MIIDCDACSASLQMDETKVPAGKFTVRCPKCKNLVRLHSRGEGKEPVEENDQFTARLGENKDSDSIPKPAPVYKPPTTRSGADAVSSTNDLMQVLTNLFQQNGATTTSASNAEYSSDDAAQSVLICLPENLREKAVRSLNEAEWKLYIADKPAQALETLEDMRIGNVIFSPSFAPESRGAFAIENYLFKKVPSERRKIFAVSVSDEAQTCNAHQAFLKNLNLVVNSADVDNLPLIMRRSRRAYDEIYRYYNKALIGF